MLRCGRAAGSLPQVGQSVGKGLVSALQEPHQLISNCKFLTLLFATFEEERPLSADELQARKTCRDIIAQAIKEKAAYWKQRSKSRAIKEEDANTAFHHAQATVRMRNNTIRFVEVQGNVIASHEGKLQALTEFFRSIIGDAGAPSWRFEVSQLFLGHHQPSQDLIAPFTELETLEALKSMNRSSAPGPDGFGPSFYRAAWDSIKLEVMAFMHAFHQGQSQLERINRSYMVLIPKKPGATAVDCFRRFACKTARSRF